MNLRRGDGPPLVIGHRGAAAVAPENTLEAAAGGGRLPARSLVEFDIGPDLRLAHSDRELPEAAVTLDAALEFLREHSLGVHLDLKQPGYEAEPSSRHSAGTSCRTGRSSRRPSRSPPAGSRCSRLRCRAQSGTRATA